MLNPLNIPKGMNYTRFENVYYFVKDICQLFYQEILHEINVFDLMYQFSQCHNCKVITKI